MFVVVFCVDADTEGTEDSEYLLFTSFVFLFVSRVVLLFWFFKILCLNSPYPAVVPGIPAVFP